MHQTENLRRPAAGWSQAKSFLASGRCAAAPPGPAWAGGRQPEAALPSLAEAEALRALRSAGDTAEVAGRALGSCPGDPDRVARPVPVCSIRAEPPDQPGTAALRAAAVLAQEGNWCERWAAAMRAMQPVLPWWRAILVAAPGWELRQDRPAPRPLAENDLSRRLAAATGAPALVDLGSQQALRDDPVRVLNRLTAALLAPAGPGMTIYVDTREGQPTPGERELTLLTHLGRLVGALAPEAEPAGDEGEWVGFQGIVGRCPAIQAVFRTVEQFATSEIPVHIAGETGTGKERVAQALHQRSRRPEGPFVAVNVATLSDELFEPEMFGHVKGAFTGAVAAREGLVAAAEGGTLFLDEVTDLSPRGQVKLLRFLQEREYRRVGESANRRANVRVLTASNISIEQRAASGHFRCDLMYRLKGAQIALPPLRERGDDLRLLTTHFLVRWARAENRPAAKLTAQVARALASYPWPGNVRELEQEMRRLAVLGAGRSLSLVDLSPHIVRASGERGASPLRTALGAFERDYIAEALRRHEGNRARTARSLGISRQALLTKLGRMAI